MELFFNYKGVNFQIMGSELFCDGITVASGITRQTTLLAIQAECDKYLSFKQAREGGKNAKF